MEKNYNTTAQVPVKEKKCPYRTINMNTYTHDIMPEEMATRMVIEMEIRTAIRMATRISTTATISSIIL